MNPTASQIKRARYHHGDLRNALLEEARKALQDTPLHSLSLRLLARRVGVSEAAPFRHFAGMDDLLAEVALQGFRELESDRRRVAGSGESARRKLYLMMRCYVDFACREPGLFGVMVGPRILNRDIYTSMQQASHDSFELFAEAVRTFAVEQGWPSDALALLVHASWSVEHGVARLIIDKRVPYLDYQVELQDMVDFSLSLLISGIERGRQQLPQRGG